MNRMARSCRQIHAGVSAKSASQRPTRCRQGGGAGARATSIMEDAWNNLSLRLARPVTRPTLSLQNPPLDLVPSTRALPPSQPYQKRLGSGHPAAPACAVGAFRTSGRHQRRAPILDRPA